MIDLSNPIPIGIAITEFGFRLGAGLFVGSTASHQVGHAFLEMEVDLGVYISIDGRAPESEIPAPGWLFAAHGVASWGRRAITPATAATYCSHPVCSALRARRPPVVIR